MVVPVINVSPSASATKKNPDSFEKNNIQSNEAKYILQSNETRTAAVAKSVDEEMRENIMNQVNSNTTILANY